MKCVKCEYTPYLDRQQSPQPPKLPELPDSGMVVQGGCWFTVASKAEIKRLNIRLRKTGAYILINGRNRPIWEKFNWDYCEKIDELFAVTQIKCELSMFPVE